jgi:peroxiredoxin
LPVPEDDGAADHLVGSPVPDVALASSTGGEIALAAAAQDLLVVYVYPRTGKPGEPSPPGWDAIPGARGCTPQSCAFRDHVTDLAAHGAAVMGLSAQTPDEQREFAEREHIPYPVLSDAELVVERVFYPVFPPDRNAADVLAWLDSGFTSA